jgi:hypothetical protein
MSALRINKTADGVEKSMPTEDPSPLLMTKGHSTHTIEEFIGLLQAHGATCVVDVRTVPRSRHNPQFNKASLPGSLKTAGLGYVHLPGLGGGTSCSARFSQLGLAQCRLSRFCGLHANAGI